MARLVGCVQLEFNHVGVERQRGNLERGGGILRSPRCLFTTMTKDQAIHRIQVAISELRDYSASQSPMDRTTADEAITMLEEVIDAIQKRRLDYTPFAA